MASIIEVEGIGDVSARKLNAVGIATTDAFLERAAPTARGTRFESRGLRARFHGPADRVTAEVAFREPTAFATGATQALAILEAEST